MKNSNAEIASVGSRVPRDRATQSWPMVRLGDVCDEVRERIPSNEIQLAQYVTTDNMIKGCGGIKEAESLPVNVGLVHYHSGDVLVSNIRPYLKKTWLADRSGGCSSDVIVFRSNRENLASEYLYRVLSQDGFFDYSMQNVSGTKMPRGKRDWIKRFEFPLPPLPVQREIVARLEKELGEADALAAKFKEIAENADAEFKAELDETFKNVEGEKVRLGDVGKIVTGSTPSKSCKGYYGGPYCFFKPSDLNQGYSTTFSSDSLTESGWVLARQLPKNSVLVTCIGATLGKVGIIRKEGTCNQQINAIIPERALSEFFYYCVLSPAFQLKLWHEADATTLPLVSKKEFSNLVISIPPITTQSAIVAKLDTERQRCEKLKAAAERGLRAAEDLRKAILAEAFEQ